MTQGSFARRDVLSLMAAAGVTGISAARTLQPDTAHGFRVDASRPATHARVDIYPDGGLARVRLHGSLTEDAERDLVSRWQELS